MRAKDVWTRGFGRAAVIMLPLLLVPLASYGTTFKVDREHTNVTFEVRHLFTNVNGRFNDFQGQIQFDPEKPGEVKVDGVIDAASINTNNEKRDQHLRSKDFFDVEKYPQIMFVSTKVTDVDPAKKTGKLHGTLTMHGVEKPVVLNVAYLGTGADPWGNTRAGFTAKTTINRKDYGVNWNETLDTGGLLLGEEIEIAINVEGIVEQ